jgi:phytoene synthase
LEPVTDSSREIIRQSGSNLAFALAVLPRRKRDDMGIFYAFCRVVDDIADEPGIPAEERRAGLKYWRDLIYGRVESPRPGIETEFVDLCRRYYLKEEDLEAIITGIEMDLEPLRFESTEDLKRYCYHVASAVGLVSIEIFGYTDPATRFYAEQLGYALQWTNIMRDVGEDAKEGRLFLPLEDLRRYGLTEQMILDGNPDKAKFQRLMKHEAGIARAFYVTAVSALPKADRAAMRSAELMRRIYSGILDGMEADGFHVYDRRYRLTKAMMLCEFLKAKYTR